MGILFCDDRRKRQSIFFVMMIIIFTSVPVFQGYFIGYADTYMSEIICLACNILTACVSFICFERIFDNNIIGAACCALYTLSVYRLGRLIVFKNINELIAMIFVPLIVYGLYEVSTGENGEKGYRFSVIPLSIGYAGSIMSDLPTFEIVMMATVIICIFVMLTRKKFKQFIIVAEAILVGIILGGWSAFLQIRDMAAFDTIQSRGLYLSGLLIQFWKIESNLPDTDPSMLYYNPVGLGIVPFIGLVIFLLLWFAGHIKPVKNDTDSFMCSMSVASVVFILMSLRLFPWDRIQTSNVIASRMVGILESPERFVGMAAICIAISIGYVLVLLKEKFQTYKPLYYVGIIVVLIGVVTSGLYLIDEGNCSADYYNSVNMSCGIGVREYVEEQD